MKGAWSAVLLVLVTGIYFNGLSDAPVYLSIEEVGAARQAHLLATTGRDLAGRPYPMYLGEPGYEAGRDPLWIYAQALLLRLAPYSEGLLRVPSALAGVLNVVLFFVLCRAVFVSNWTALMAASLFALTPANFLQARIATAQIGPVPFVVGWLILFHRYCVRGQRRDLFLTGLCLGAGIYTFLSGLIMLPVFLAVTAGVLAARYPEHRDRSLLVREGLALAGGFALALAPWVIWHVLHPERFTQLAEYYSHNGYNEGASRTQLLSLLIERVDRWWNAFNLEPLFFSGDSNPRFSPGNLGHFLIVQGVLAAVGLWHFRRIGPPAFRRAVAIGLVLSPLPAVLAGDPEIKRWVVVMPFVLLTIAAGVDVLRHTGAPARVVLAALLVGAIAQFATFQRDYFGDYRARSSFFFGGNVKGAVLLTLDIPQPECVFLDARLAMTPYWAFYTAANGRTDLARQPNVVDTEQAAFSVPALCQESAIIMLNERLSENPVYGERLRTGGWQATAVPEINRGPLLAVLRRNSA